MKIILSRKGFDGTAGGCASPIFPDGSMVSMPIPDTTSHSYTYGDLQWNDLSYADIMTRVFARKQMTLHGKGCHIDPDINPDAWSSLPRNWVPAFGQIGSAQTTLRKAGVGPGDLFLFFGWFHQTEYRKDGSLKYSSAGRCLGDMQVIYGYLEVSSIVSDSKEIKQFSWHPHAVEERLEKKNNVLYLPSSNLSLIPELPGWGTLSFDEKRILTKKGSSRSIWRDLPFLRPENLIAPKKKNCAEGNAIQYKGQWQELIFNGTPQMIEWVKSVLV